METKPTPRKYDPHTKTTEHICVICGQKFKSNYSLTKYCSKDCQAEAARRRREGIIIPKQPTVESAEPTEPIQATPTQPIQITIQQPQEATKPTTAVQTTTYKEKPTERQIIEVIPDDWKYPTPRKYDPHKRLYKRTCTVCGQEYLTNSRKSMYCSQVCQMRKWRDDEQKREQQEANEIENKIAQLESDNIAKGTQLLFVRKELEELEEILAEAKKRLKLEPHDSNWYYFGHPVGIDTHLTPLEKEHKDTANKLKFKMEKITELEKELEQYKK